MPLGTELDLGPGDIVLDGHPAPHGKGQSSPPTSAHVYYGQTVVHLSNCWALVMVALWNRADHYIFTLWFLLSSFFFLLLFFLA